jgi:hypothetical protein
MDTTVRAILDSLPPKPRASKLTPQAALIRALRTRGRSYREIVTILRERCGVRVGLHTLYHFVRVRTRNSATTPHSCRSQPSRRARQSSTPAHAATPVAASEGNDEEAVWTRIAALKRRSPQAPAVGAKKEFEYDETQPLQLAPVRQPKKT